MKKNVLVAIMLWCCTGPIQADGTIYKVEYPTDTLGLQMPVTYRLWVPDTKEPLRAVIVHQHGCGVGACQGGRTAADDLHWQALARKWNCALLGPSYGQGEKQNCRLWCDPRNGSAKTFLKCLDDFSQQSKRPELTTIPWCLWGHSGGGFWASIMQTLYPTRIVAIWCRSGTALPAWTKGEIPEVKLTKEVFEVPVALNPGFKERGHKQFNGAWTGAVAMMNAYRAENAPICFCPDPVTAHECGGSRFLAIPFFDTCLGLRLSKKAGDPSLAAIPKEGRLVEKVKIKEFSSTFQEVDDELTHPIWFPSKDFRKLWQEYVSAGWVKDNTPPAAPFDVQVVTQNGKTFLIWDAHADLESGVSHFEILQNGKVVSELKNLKAKGVAAKVFQSISYHDTPMPDFQRMQFPITDASSNYSVVAVNGAGLKSPATAQK
ncbi:MAG: hypothetical protein R3B84_08605 [Zavarzinella sp.]